MIRAYFDESETPDQAQGYFVVAGVVAEARRWGRFERDWRHVLDEFCAPYLHMKEYAHRKGPFLGWAEAKRASFLGQLSHVLASQKKYIRSVSCAISAEDYGNCLSHAEKGEAGHPYLLCLRQCAANVLALFKADAHSHQINFVFDGRPDFIGKAVDALSELKVNPRIPPSAREMIVGITPGDDLKILPLQAADYFAYEVNKYYREPTRRRQSLLAINPVEGFHTLVTRDAQGRIRNESTDGV